MSINMTLQLCAVDTYWDIEVLHAVLSLPCSSNLVVVVIFFEDMFYAFSNISIIITKKFSETNFFWRHTDTLSVLLLSDYKLARGLKYRKIVSIPTIFHKFYPK